MKVALALILVLFAQVSLAVTSNDAVNTVVAANHYLYDSETYAAPNVAIEYEGKQYWVIPLTANTEIVTYFPVEVSTGKLSVSRQANRGLFEVSDSLRGFQILRDTVSKGGSVEWLFTEKFDQVFQELALQLGDEVFQLNTVESTLKQSKVNVDLSPLKSDLKSMSERSQQVSSAISTARAAESEFIKKPSKVSLSAMNDSFNSVFGLIAGFNDASLSYRSKIDKVKQEISTANIDPQEKAQLSQIIEPPQGLNSVRNYNLDAIQIKASIESVFSDSSSKGDSLLSEFENRVLKNDVYNLLYSDNDRLSKEGFSNLSEAQKVILSKENIEKWKATEKVNALKQDYSKALDFYNKKNFSQAQKSANLAIDDSIAVIRAGQYQSAPGNLPQDFLFEVAGILLVLLALLFIFNNRGKIRSMFAGEKEELDLYR